MNCTLSVGQYGAETCVRPRLIGRVWLRCCYRMSVHPLSFGRSLIFALSLRLVIVSQSSCLRFMTSIFIERQYVGNSVSELPSTDRSEWPRVRSSCRPIQLPRSGSIRTRKHLRQQLQHTLHSIDVPAQQPKLSS